MFLNWFIPALLVTAAVGLLVFSLMFKKNEFTTKDLALAAVCVGLSFALSFWRVWHNPQGGSITIASMLPIALFAYIAGFRKGLIVGLAYGALQLIQDPQIYHPVQVLLDYFLGFGAVAAAGAFKHIKAFKKCDFLLGITAAGLLRFACSIISGVVFFQAYVPEGWGLWPYSLAYNSVLLIDIAICLVPAAFIQYVPALRKFMNYMDDGKNFGAGRNGNKMKTCTDGDLNGRCAGDTQKNADAVDKSGAM